MAGIVFYFSFDEAAEIQRDYPFSPKGLHQLESGFLTQLFTLSRQIKWTVEVWLLLEFVPDGKG